MTAAADGNGKPISTAEKLLVAAAPALLSPPLSLLFSDLSSSLHSPLIVLLSSSSLYPFLV